MSASGGVRGAGAITGGVAGAAKRRDGAGAVAAMDRETAITALLAMMPQMRIALISMAVSLAAARGRVKRARAFRAPALGSRGVFADTRLLDPRTS